MNKLSGIIYLGLAGSLAFSALQAQTTDDRPYQERVVVVAPYQPVLDVVRKPLLQPEVPADTTHRIDSAVCEIISRPVQTTYPVENIKPAKVAGEPVERLFNQHLKIGFGNHLSPLAEAYVAMGRSQQYGVAASYKHHSAYGKIKDYSQFKTDHSYNEGDLSGEIYAKKFKVRLELDYRQTKVNAYGIRDGLYDTISGLLAMDEDFRKIYRDQPVRWFQNMDGRLSITDRATDPNDWRYDAALYYDFGRNNWYGMENIIEADGGFSKRIAQKSDYVDRLDIGARVFFGDYLQRPHQDDPVDNAYQLRVEPTVSYHYDIFNLDAGLCFNVFGDNRDGNKFQFHPRVRLDVQAVPDILDLYVGVDGQVKRNTILSISEINPFLHPTDPDDLAFTREKLYVYLGVKSNLTREIDFALTASTHWLGNYMSFDYYYYPYQLSVAGESYVGYNDFKPLYTEKVFQFQLKGELNLHWDDRILAHVEAEYNYYNQSLLYTPAFRGGLMFRYDIGHKFIITSEIAGYTNMKAHDHFGREVTLKGGFDWSAGLEYRFFKRWSAFVNLNNLIAYRYYRWYDYPTYRFNVMVGITFSF